MSRTDLDGTTVFSDEAGLPGAARLLAWSVVRDDNSAFDVHCLWDSHDVDDVFKVALAHAAIELGALSSGIVAVTVNDIANAAVRSYPESALSIETEVSVDVG